MSPEHKRFKVFFKEILPSTSRPYRNQMTANQKMHVSNDIIKDVLPGDTKFLLPTRRERTIEIMGFSLAHLFISSGNQCIFHRDPESTFPDFPGLTSLA